MTANVMGMAGLGARLNAWLEQFATRPYASGILFIVAFIEGSIAPLPPDIPFIALSQWLQVEMTVPPGRKKIVS